MTKPASAADAPTEVLTWTLTELRDSAIDLFKKELQDWLERVYARGKETGVIPREARTLERDMRRLVQKQVHGYSPAEIVALEQGAEPSDLDKLNFRHISQSDERAVAKSSCGSQPARA